MSIATAKDPELLATCLVCGCDDNHACQPGGCAWVWVCRREKVGICTECQGALNEQVAARRHSPCTKRLLAAARQARKRGQN